MKYITNRLKKIITRNKITKSQIINKIKLELLDTIYNNFSLEKNKEISKFIQLLNKTIRENDLPIKLKVGGSYAKETYLGNDFDVDIFLRVENDEVQKTANKLVKLLPIKANLVHGSRDYYQIFYNNVKYELVPNKYIQNIKEAVNTTDYSPLHVDFLKEQMKENKTLNDEIRVTKLFFKACNCYGAESYLNSFSGHSLDVLVSYFETFENTIQFLSNIDIKNLYLIDISNFYKDKYNKSINLSISNEDSIKIKKQFDNKINSSLIIIDPIDKNRIASSALNNYRLKKLKYYSKLFIKNPSESFFKREIKFKNNRHNLILRYKPKNENLDICGANVLAIKKRISTFLSENDFDIIDNFDFKNRKYQIKKKDFVSRFEDIYYKDRIFLLKIILRKKKLKKIKIIKGPLIDKIDSVNSFKKVHNNTFVKDINNKKYIFAKEKRKLQKLDEYVDLFFIKRKDIEKYVERI